jgi:hypothetical protein
MIHIAPWEAAVGLVNGAARVLPAGGVLYLYGPYCRHGRHTAPSNEVFDRSLRRQNPNWGVRDLEAMTELAEENGFAQPIIKENAREQSLPHLPSRCARVMRATPRTGRLRRAVVPAGTAADCAVFYPCNQALERGHRAMLTAKRLSAHLRPSLSGWVRSFCWQAMPARLTDGEFGLRQ